MRLTPSNDPARRRKQLAAIHVMATTQLGMDRDAYQAMLKRVAKVDSAATLDAAGRDRVLKELRRLGGQKKPYPGRPHNADHSAMPELIAKIEALLADMKLSWAYADAIAKQQCGMDKVAWVRKPDSLRAIIAALAVEQEKRSLEAAVQAELSRLGWAVERVIELMKPLRPNWRRHRPSLHLVLDFLSGQEA